MSSSEHRPSLDSGRTRTDVDELFATARTVRSAADLAHDGIFEDDELGEFIADLYSARRADLA